MRYKKLIFIVGLVSLTACDLGAAPEIKELRRLCALDAGQKIYETVEADGYFDESENGRGVVSSLIVNYELSKFQYIEFCKDKPPNRYGDSILLEPGCYRAEKVPRNSERCNIDADKFLKKYNNLDKAKDQCVAIDKISKPTARFKLLSSTKEWLSEEDQNNKYVKYSRSIFDRDRNKNIAEEVDYAIFYKGKNAVYNFGCNSPEVTKKSQSTYPKNIFTETIRPLKK